MSTRQAASAVNRFGLGARPGELDQARDARGWLHAQLHGRLDLRAFQALPDSLELLRDETDFKRAKRAQKRQRSSQQTQPEQTRRTRFASQAGAEDRSGDGNSRDDRRRDKLGRRELMQLSVADIAARYREAANTQRPFVERLVHFWSNHFAVSIDKGPARLFAAPMERESIRPHLLGNFRELLLAVETHPAMLRYLDNVKSVGEDSMMATQRTERSRRRSDGKPPRKYGLNENLAREILELHTVGANGGYSQTDVTEFARALTGWGVPQQRALADASSAFLFMDRAHESGTRRILGRTYPQTGEDQGGAILADLALQPATAQHLSLKLARHFIADAPPATLVQRMARAYLASGGELTALYAALIDDDAAWSTGARKFKTPHDFVVSAMRAGAFSLDQQPDELTDLLLELGQPAFTPRSPAGYPDTTGDWAAGDALRKRLQVAGTLAERVVGARTPLQLAHEVLGAGGVTGDLGSALGRAGSPQDGYALLFASPAFQWRT